jgi:ATP-dependent NAD(P)H-hydrate dehydratase
VWQIRQWISRLDALVVGPGLGRELDALRLASDTLRMARESTLPVVVDADGLAAVAQDPDSVRGYARAVLTPNLVECRRLLAALSPESTAADPSSPQSDAATLASLLDGVVVLRKGPVDMISSGSQICHSVSSWGSPRRCGGQGDILAGALAVFLAWAARSTQQHSSLDLHIAASALLVRHASQAAFAVHGRALGPIDIIARLGSSFATLFDEKT